MQAAEEESKQRRISAPWAYARSLAWVRPVLILAVLYICSLSLIVALFSQLPTLSALAGAQREVKLAPATTKACLCLLHGAALCPVDQ